MIMPHKVHRKSYGLFALAVIMLLGGAALFIEFYKIVLFRSFGLLMCMASVYFIKISHVHSHVGLLTLDGQFADDKATKRPGPIMWTLSGGLLVALGLSFIYLYRDALGGYHKILPVYIFAATIVVCAIVWSYLISKIF